MNNSSRDNHDNRYPNIGNVSIAILENLVKPALGDTAVNIIKAPVIEKELRSALSECLKKVEFRLVNEFDDPYVCQLLISLPPSDLNILQNAVRNFYKNPFDKTLSQILSAQLLSDCRHVLDENRISRCVEKYIEFLREELVPISAEIREKLQTQSVMNTEKQLEQILDYLKTLHPKNGVSGGDKGCAPAPPVLIIGRDQMIRELKECLGIVKKNGQALKKPLCTVIRGWPGVGKTTIVSTIAHDPETFQAYPDGVLWVSLGTNPRLLSELTAWGNHLGTDEIQKSQSIDDARACLSRILSDKRMLLMIDDVWKPEHAVPFMVGGRDCATVITTRSQEVAQALVNEPSQIYLLPVLTDEYSFELLSKIAPLVVENYPEDSQVLIKDLEGLPLAIQVAGRLLRAELAAGFGVKELIKELKEGARLLESQAPSDRIDLISGTTPTIAALLQKSVEMLSPLARECFAFLGVFAPKPATFDVNAIETVWEIDNPKAVIIELVNRGLLEYVAQSSRYQMHALLVMQAKSILR